MLVIRPVTPADLPQLVELAGLASFGLTTLPKDPDFLRRRIRDSERGFERITDAEPRGESYLFVMEEMRTGRILGTSGIVSKVGGFEPFYAFRIETERYESETLGVYREITMLHLVRDHDGPCEIGSMFIHPDARGRGAGRALSLARFLFIAEHPKSFDATVIAEMRGVIDDRGTSDFWNAVGHHFYEIDFPKADYLSILNKRFIADLMPRHPIYVALLPPEAQAVIGHPAIFLLTWGVNGYSDSMVDAAAWLVGTAVPAFRACATAVEMTRDEGVVLPREAAEALGVVPGDTVRIGRLKPTPGTSP